LKKEKAKLILQKIKEECDSVSKYSECSFYIGDELDSYCVFDAKDSEYGYDGTPVAWKIEAMPNLR
jgi:hypothetical protein